MAGQTFLSLSLFAYRQIIFKLTLSLRCNSFKDCSFMQGFQVYPFLSNGPKAYFSFLLLNPNPPNYEFLVYPFVPKQPSL